MTEDIVKFIDRVIDGRVLHGVKRSNGFSMPPESEQKVYNYITEIGRRFDENFVLDDDNRWAYTQFAKWIIADETMQAQNATGDIIDGDLTKGIYIAGHTGTGKSLAMEVMRIFSDIKRTMLYAAGDWRPVVWRTDITAATIWDEAANDGKSLQRYTKTGILCIQDLGAEPDYDAVFMGARRQPLRQLLEARGDRRDLVTLITSNYDYDDPTIMRRYGERVVSRLHRMCNLLFINGKDRRR